MRDAWRFEAPGRMVDSGGSRLHLQISGSGGPVVVLEAGIGATSLSWALVVPQIAKMTTVVSYDRGGLGWSGPAVTPRTPFVICTELRAALRNVGLEGPYILVGHSFGGLVVQRFAELFREDVAGVVLLDPLSPSEWCPMTAARQRTLLRGVRLARRGAILARMGIVGASLRLLVGGNHILPRLAARVSSGAGGSGVVDRLVGEVRKLPRELWPVIAWQWSQAKNFEGIARHLECLPDSALEMTRSRVDPSVAVVACLAEKTSAREFQAGWKVVRTEGCGHWMQLDRPDVVVAAIADVIADALD